MGYKIDNFPKIRYVALEMAYDSGMINRMFTQDEFLSACDVILGSDGVDEADLHRLEIWLITLTDDQLSVLAAGDQDDMMLIEKTCPKNSEGQPLSNLFNDIFEMEYPE